MVRLFDGVHVLPTVGGLLCVHGMQPDTEGRRSSRMVFTQIRRLPDREEMGGDTSRRLMPCLPCAAVILGPGGGGGGGGRRAAGREAPATTQRDATDECGNVGSLLQDKMRRNLV